MTTGKQKAPRGVSLRRAFDGARADVVQRLVAAGATDRWDRQREMERAAYGDRLVALLVQAADLQGKLLTWIQGEEKAATSSALLSVRVGGTARHAMGAGRQALEMAIDVLNTQIDDARYLLRVVQAPARGIDERPAGFPAQAATAAATHAAVADAEHEAWRVEQERRREERRAQGTTPTTPGPNPGDCAACDHRTVCARDRHVGLFRPLTDGRCNNYLPIREGGKTDA